jgi:hypothetical protein
MRHGRASQSTAAVQDEGRAVSAAADDQSRASGANESPGLIAYPVQTGSDMRLVPAPLERDWLDATADRFGYRCLPVLIANQAGWFILNSHALDVVWNGGDAIEDLTVTYREGESPYPALSHFGHGILTWHIPFLFETPPGVQLLARGPANAPKDGICALEGVVETDWVAATFTMNWQLTRARRRVSFDPGEPICMVVPVSLDLLEQARPEIRRLASDPERQSRFQTWSARRAAFLADLNTPGSEAMAEGWQKDYFRGRSPDGSSAPSHRTRLRLHPFLDVDGFTPAIGGSGGADPGPAGE